MIRDVLRHYWTHILAIAVFACAAVRYWRLGNFLDVDRLTWIIIAFVGLVLVLQGDEFTVDPLDDSERWTRDPDWDRRRSYTYQCWTGPILGAIALGWGTIALYRL
ncbi:MAG: hypothetical protein ACYC35_22610 [Pirellulales bacterium]